MIADADRPRRGRLPANGGHRFLRYNASSSPWGYSSAGRALAWHARGHRFDPVYLHHLSKTESPQVTTLSSRGLGHPPFTVSTGVRIPLGSPVLLQGKNGMSHLHSAALAANAGLP